MCEYLLVSRHGSEDSDVCMTLWKVASDVGCGAAVQAGFQSRSLGRPAESCAQYCNQRNNLANPMLEFETSDNIDGVYGMVVWCLAEEKCVGSTATGECGRSVSRAQEGLAITARLAPTLTA